MGEVEPIPLAILTGDGMGTEITEAALTVFKAAARQARFAVRPKSALVGWRAYEKHHSTLPEALVLSATPAVCLSGSCRAH